MPVFCRLILLSGLILGLWLPAHATEPSMRFERLTVSNGLSNNQITAVLQDRSGFIWIATQDGLNRYDGHNIRIFRPDATDVSSISDHKITDMIEDTDGMLWFATYRGLNRFDPATEQFQHFRHDPQDRQSLSHDQITTIIEDKRGIIWAGTRGGGINLIDPSTGSISHLSHSKDNPKGLSGNDVRTIIEDDLGNIWIGTARSGLNRFDPVSQTFAHYRHNPNDLASLSQSHISVLHQDAQGTIWVGTYDRALNRYNRQTDDFRRFESKGAEGQVNTAYILSLHTDEIGQLRVGTYGGGLNIYNPDKQSFYQYRHNSNDPHSLSNNYVRTIYQDRQGVLWIGTDHGLNRHVLQSRRFNHFKHDSKDPFSLSHNDVKAIVQSQNGQVWLATYGGLNRYDPKTKRFDHYRHIINDDKSLSTNRLRTLALGPQGELWLGTFAKGVSSFAPDTGEFKHFSYHPNDTSSINHPHVTAIHLDKQDNLWLGTLGGLARYHPEQQSFERYQHQPDTSNSLGHNYVSAVYSDNQGYVWVGFREAGLDRFDPKTQQFDHFRHDKSLPHSISSNRITAIFQDQQARLWVGTAGGGLNRYDEQHKGFKHYRVEHGLPSNVIAGIVQDNQGYLWLSTNNGLSRMNIDTESFRNFSDIDGLQGNEFNFGAAFRSPDGELFFGGKNGFNRFNPAQLGHTIPQPALAFTDFRLFNQSVAVSAHLSNKPGDRSQLQQTDSGEVRLSKAIHAIDHLTLSHQQNLFSFEFAALQFINPKASRYAYKLQPWNKDWIQTSADNRQATFTNIPAGDYILKVKATDHTGKWHDKQLTLPLTILPPWWFSGWMKVIYGLLILLLLAWIYYRLTVIPGKRAAMLQQMVNNRTAEIAQQKDTIEHLLKLNSRFAQNISHSLKTPLNLIIGPIERMLAQQHIKTDDLQRVKRNALRLQKEVDTLVAFSHDGITTEQAIVIPVCETCKAIVADIQIAFEQKQQRLHFKCQGQWYVKAEPDAIAHILINLLENAMKYTPTGGQIEVEVLGQNDSVIIKVADTGFGIAQHSRQQIFERGVRLDATQDQQGTGIGLAYVKEIVERNHGAIEVEPNMPTGSVFKVTLPAIDDARAPFAQVSHHSKSLINTINNLAKTQQTEATLQIEQPQQAAKPKLLLVEDDDDMRAFMMESFSENFCCFQACDGEQGLQMARQYQPDLIISDVMMPRKNGLAMLAEIKADSALSQISVILVTAAGDIAGQQQALNSGALHYFSKPFDEQQLHQAVEEALDLKKFATVRIEQQLIQGRQLSTEDFTFIQASDLKLLNQLSQHLQLHYPDMEFSNPVNSLAKQLFIEPRTLRRKLSLLLNENPATLLRNVRLEHGRRLLEQGEKPVKIYHQVGFSSQEYFGRCFKNKYGVTPNQHMGKHSIITTT